MKNTFKGWYNLSGASDVMQQINQMYAVKHYGSLSIVSDKVVLNYEGKELELPKSQITNIETKFWGRFQINHSNSNISDVVIFNAWWPFGISKAFQGAGYTVK